MAHRPVDRGAGHDRESRAASAAPTSTLEFVRRAVMSDHADQGSRRRRRGRQPAVPAGRCGARTRGAVARAAHRRRSRVSRRSSAPSDFGERALRITWRRAGDAAAARRADSGRRVPARRRVGQCRERAGRAHHAQRGNADRGARRRAARAPRKMAIRSASQNSSTRYPLIATATVSRAAVFAEHADLRTVGTFGGAVLALLIIALALLIPVARPRQSDRRNGARARGRRVRARTTSRSSICAAARSSAPRC